MKIFIKCVKIKVFIFSNYKNMITKKIMSRAFHHFISYSFFTTFSISFQRKAWQPVDFFTRPDHNEFFFFMYYKNIHGGRSQRRVGRKTEFSWFQPRHGMGKPIPFFTMLAPHVLMSWILDMLFFLWSRWVWVFKKTRFWIFFMAMVCTNFYFYFC